VAAGDGDGDEDGDADGCWACSGGPQIRKVRASNVAAMIDGAV
jgi:voltage-gated potassium channel